MSSMFSGPSWAAKSITSQNADDATSSADFTKKDTLTRLGDKLYPLLCVSVHEHAWLGSGYGIWGKEEYMKRFWSVLDWDKVVDRWTKFAPAARS